MQRCKEVRGHHFLEIVLNAPPRIVSAQCIQASWPESLLSCPASHLVSGKLGLLMYHSICFVHGCWGLTPGCQAPAANTFIH